MKKAFSREFAKTHPDCLCFVMEVINELGKLAARTEEDCTVHCARA